MKKVSIIFICIAMSLVSYSQITITKKEGGSVVTKLGYGIVVNEGSTLIREKIILNDADCLIQLEDEGIETKYSDRSYSFSSTGICTTKEPISAYEIHHVLYNVFGEDMVTLSSKEIRDIKIMKRFENSSSWFASESDVRGYFVLCFFVAKLEL